MVKIDTAIKRIEKTYNEKLYARIGSVNYRVTNKDGVKVLLSSYNVDIRTFSSLIDEMTIFENSLKDNNSKTVNNSSQKSAKSKSASNKGKTSNSKG